MEPVKGLTTVVLDTDEVESLISIAKAVSTLTDSAKIRALGDRLSKAKEASIPTYYVNIYSICHRTVTEIDTNVNEETITTGWYDKLCDLSVPYTDIEEALEGLIDLAQHYLNPSAFEQSDYTQAKLYEKWEASSTRPIDRTVCIGDPIYQRNRCEVRLEFGPAASQRRHVGVYQCQAVSK